VSTVKKRRERFESAARAYLPALEYLPAVLRFSDVVMWTVEHCREMVKASRRLCEVSDSLVAESQKMIGRSRELFLATMLKLPELRFTGNGSFAASGHRPLDEDGWLRQFLANV